MMHRRRRRRSGKLSGWNLMSWARGGGGLPPPSAVSSSTAASTKKALTNTADTKGELAKDLDRGNECCPAIRVKCERRTVDVKVKVPKFEKFIANPYGGNTYKRRKVMVEQTVQKKVKLCSVTAGKHQGELLPPREAQREVKMLKALLTQENCNVKVLNEGAVKAKKGK